MNTTFPDLGPNAIFIWSAYAVMTISVVTLVLAIVFDDRRQRRRLAELEERGIRRRSAETAAKADAGSKPKAKSKPRAKAAGTTASKPRTQSRGASPQRAAKQAGR